MSILPDWMLFFSRFDNNDLKKSVSNIMTPDWKVEHFLISPSTICVLSSK